MIVSWILYSLILGAVLALGAVVVDRAARASRMPRRFTWLGSLALLVALTLLAPWRADRALGGFGNLEQVSSTAITPSAEQTALSIAEQVLAWVVSSVQKVIEGVAAAIPISLDRAIGIVWALASLLALALVWVTLVNCDRQRREWPYTRIHGKRVRLGGSHGPAVYGVFSSEIVVPTALLNCSVEDQHLVLAHEDEHRRAHDPLLLALSAICVALLPWHPVAWWLASRLRLAVELDCDGRVLSRGAPVRDYGEMLVRLAGIVPARPSVVPTLALLDSSTHLEQRLITMTTRPVRRTPFRVVTFLAAAASVIVLACNAEVPTAAQIRDADATTIARDLRLSPASVVYKVDGKEVAEADAQKIRPEDIQSIDIRRSPGGNGERSEVYILTKSAQGSIDASQRPAGVVRQRGESAQPLMLRDLERTPASASEQPLFIVDDVVVSSIKGLNPNDIATVEVVKGDAASSRYGDKGRNGVVVIRTKK